MRARGLAAIGGKDRGDSGEPHRWYKTTAEWWRTAGDEEDGRWGVELVGAALRVQRESVEGRVGCGGGRSWSWAPFIGLEREESGRAMMSGGGAH
jgi:hypothetical protein